MKKLNIKEEDTNRNTFLLIDCLSICHKVKHTMGNLSYEQHPTGVIFGFMMAMFNLAKKFKTNKFIFCWDSKTNFRKDLYSGYKAQRAESYSKLDEEALRINTLANKQFKQLRKEIIPELGFENNLVKKGYEADDIIANVLKNNPFLYVGKNKAVIVTTDQDLYQLIKMADIYNHRTKELLDYDWYKKTYGMVYWEHIKAVSGCKSDDVIGVKGVGEEVVVKFFRDGDYEKWVNNRKGGDGEFGRKQKMIIDFMCSSQYLTNYKLVALPLEGMPSIYLDKKKIKNEKIEIAKFEKLCYSYGLVSFLKNEGEWIKIFNME